MGVVIIPFDYEQLPESQRKKSVPICIASVDRHGNTIAPVWFEKGVAPVQNRLRNIAQFKLGDVRRVSELAEITVHKLWERHGDNAGIVPASRVLLRAAWEARELALGDSPWRVNHRVPLALGSLEHDVHENGLPDPKQYDQIYEQKILLDLIERRIKDGHRDDIRPIFRMLRQGFTWKEIAHALGDGTAEAPKKRFWRWIRENFPKKHP